MALIAELKMATAVLDPLGRGLRIAVQLQDDVLGIIGPKTIDIDDPELFTQVVDIIESYLPYLEQKLQISVQIPSDLATANTV